MDKRIKEFFFNEWKQTVKRCLAKLGIPYDDEAEIIAYVAVYNFGLVTKEYMRQVVMDRGLDQMNPHVKQIFDAFLQPMEPLEDALKVKSEKCNLS